MYSKHRIYTLASKEHKMLSYYSVKVTRTKLSIYCEPFVRFKFHLYQQPDWFPLLRGRA